MYIYAPGKLLATGELFLSLISEGSFPSLIINGTDTWWSGVLIVHLLDEFLDCKYF